MRVGFLDRLWGFLFGDAETRKRVRLIKIFVRDIKNSGYGYFYKPFGRNLTPGFALYFYEIYRVCAPLQAVFKSPDLPDGLRTAVLNHFLDDNALEIIESLTPEYLNLQYGQCGRINSLHQQTDKIIDDLNKKLDNRWRIVVDNCYKLISSFIWIATFDYYIMLKKFNDKLPEFFFGAPPVFSKTAALNVVEYIKDFLAVAEGVDFEADWSVVFSILRDFNPKADMTEENRLYIFSHIQSIVRSRVLHMIVRHVTGELDWKNKIIVPHKMIASSFLNGIIDKARKTLYGISCGEKDNVINKYVQSLFGSGETLTGAKYYVEEHNGIYSGTGIDGFKYTGAFNYCILFLSLYFEKLKSICDTFIIYGSWIDKENMYELSHWLHEITILNELLYSYDRTLSPSGERGNKLKHMEVNSVQGGPQRNSLCRYLVAINDEVFMMVNRLIKALSPLYSFFLRFRLNSGAKLAEEVVNFRTVCAMLKDKGCDMAFAEEKTADFLSLLTHIGFE
jgi:hypothetical protein